MSKRVHFAATNITYEPGYRTPSPSYSATSLPSSSSSELLTPPPDDEERRLTVYPRTPYAKQLDLYPLEVASPNLSNQMQIHFLLAFTPYSEPAIWHDLSLPLSSLETLFPTHAFSEPATSPPIPSLTIFHPLIKYKIEVSPTPPVPGAFVSVRDVLSKLYLDLRLAIHPSEYADVPELERPYVDEAYWRRCGRIRNPADKLQEEQKGIKRIDLLMGNTRFTGLSGTLRGPDIWELNVAAP